MLNSRTVQKEGSKGTVIETTRDISSRKLETNDDWERITFSELGCLAARSVDAAPHRDGRIFWKRPLGLISRYCKELQLRPYLPCTQ